MKVCQGRCTMCSLPCKLGSMKEMCTSAHPSVHCLTNLNVFVHMPTFNMKATHSVIPDVHGSWRVLKLSNVWTRTKMNSHTSRSWLSTPWVNQMIWPRSVPINQVKHQKANRATSDPELIWESECLCWRQSVERNQQDISDQLRVPIQQWANHLTGNISVLVQRHSVKSFYLN